MDYLNGREPCCSVLLATDPHFNLNNKNHRHEDICMEIVSSDPSDLVFSLSSISLAEDLK